MKKVLNLLKKSGETHDNVINTYAEQAKKDLYQEFLQPALSLISSKKMEILSLEESISLRTDVNAGLKKMSYSEIKSALSRIVSLKSEIAALEDSYEYVEAAYIDLFDDHDPDSQISSVD